MTTTLSKVTVALAVCLCLLPVTTAHAKRTHRYALLIGANLGGRGVTPLRYAESDAQRLAETLRSLGGFPADQVVVMNGVNASDVRDALINLNARLRNVADEAVLLVYYSGHATGDSLQLSDSRLDVHELSSLLQGSAAATRLLILDACRSGEATRVKGGRPAPEFEVLFGEPLPKGVAILTSSAATEDSQESETLRGSFFSHFFNSALMGAADTNTDGTVSVSEAFGFASRETSAATLYTQAGPQHPTFKIDWGGREDLVLTRPRTLSPQSGALQFMDAGRYVVSAKDARSGVDLPVAEVAARTGGTMLALQPGTYRIVRRGSDHVLEGQADVHGGDVVRLSSEDMKRHSYARGVRKGGSMGVSHSVVVAGGLGWNPLVENIGPIGLLTYRQDRRVFSGEVRLAGEMSNRLHHDLRLYSKSVSLTAAAILPKDFDWITLAAGVGFGLAAIHQTADVSYNEFVPGLQAPRLPEQLPSTLSWAATAVPLLQAELPLKARGYLRLEAALPLEWMRTQEDALHSQRRLFLSARLLLGFGFYL